MIFYSDAHSTDVLLHEFHLDAEGQSTCSDLVHPKLQTSVTG